MTENGDQYVIRRMRISDFAEVVKIWQGLYSEGIYNETYLKMDPDGHFVAQDLNSGIIYTICMQI